MLCPLHLRYLKIILYTQPGQRLTISAVSGSLNFSTIFLIEVESATSYTLAKLSSLSMAPSVIEANFSQSPATAVRCEKHWLVIAMQYERHGLTWTKNNHVRIELNNSDN